MSRLTGQVKWFSRDRGLGFIKQISREDNDNDNDIFVHYTGLRTSANDVYKTLYDGEYVEYEEKTLEDGRKIAVLVTGIYEHELMCENVYKKKQNNNRRKKNSNDDHNDDDDNDDNDDN
jgi:cold shock CspA family protein